MNAQGGHQMARKKILLVDDSETSLMMSRMILSKASYDIVVAKDGLEGVEKALAELPDLILLDVVMPKMNGFEACARIRAEEGTKAIPVIIVTTRGEETNVETGFSAGCNDYITKPINGLELLTKVRSLLGD
jgi:DNA-binding response OmpR family regulator